MTEEGADRKGNAFVYVTMCTCTLTYSTRIRVHVRARCSVRLWGNCWCAGVGAGMKLADGREKPRRSEKRCRGRRRKGESWWGALERVEWVRGVSFEPLNFAKFETVRGRGDSPSDVHSASTLLLPPLLSFYLSLSFSISLFPSWFSLHRSLLLSITVYDCTRRTRLSSLSLFSLLRPPSVSPARRCLCSSFSTHPPLPETALRRTLSAVVVLWKF